MSGKLYVKNHLPLILLNLLGALALSLFLLATGNAIQTVLFILITWMLVLILCLTICYLSRKKRLDKLLEMAGQLKERYLIPEVMQKPDRAEEQVFYQILKMSEKSMLERIGEVERERGEYRAYIEQWVHEVKTPITALKLLCENNRSPFSRDVLAELENINRYTEQALYYARSEHTEKDYSIREMNLADVVHGAIADNKYLLRQCDMAITVDDLEPVVYADDKWVRFILNQIISNAVKYRAPQHPALRIFTERSDDQVLLSIADNGIGIPESDLPRIFEKGFTGQNGRTIHSSTGIGLYLCKRLCDKLGIGLAASSSDKGTTITLSFHINDFITGVQS
jgi:signal transduction histidine kinase